MADLRGLRMYGRLQDAYELTNMADAEARFGDPEQEEGQEEPAPKYYIEVHRATGEVTMVDPSIPPWGTQRGDIKEFDTLEEAETEMAEWQRYFASLD